MPIDGKIDYRKLTSVKRMVEGVYQNDNSKIQQMPISLSKNIGQINFIDRNYIKTAFENPIDSYNSYEIKHLYLFGTNNSLFSNLGELVEYEFIVEMTLNATGARDVTKHLFIVFPIKNDTAIGTAVTSHSTKEFSKIIGNSSDNAVKKNVNLDFLINGDNTGSFYLTSKDKNKFIIIYEEPIYYREEVVGEKKIDTYSTATKPQQLNFVNADEFEIKYYSGGSYYAECGEVDVDDDGKASTKTSDESDVPEIKWEKYYSYIIGILSGLFLVVICWAFLSGGSKWGVWCHNFLNFEKKPMLEKTVDEIASDLSEVRD